MRVVLWVCAAIASLAGLADARAEGDGLTTSADRVPWARFTARVVDAPSWRATLAPSERYGLRVGNVGVLGDHYFGGSAISQPSTGGFRATSGLISALGTKEATRDGISLPYVGLGYSNIWPKSGWRFNADLGVASYSPTAASGIGRVIGGSQSLDDLVRDLRLAPVLQMGVSYSF